MSEWISVKDRLPVEGKFYIVHGNGEVFVGAYFPSSPGHWAVHTKLGPTWLDGVAHWMPLPEPPKETHRGRVSGDSSIGCSAHGECPACKAIKAEDRASLRGGGEGA